MCIRDRLKAKDPQNKDKEIWADQDIKNLHAEHKIYTCRGCGSINCRIFNKLTFDQNIKKGKHLGSCTRRPTTFGNSDKYAKTWTPPNRNFPKKNQKNDNNSTIATVTTSPSTIESSQMFSEQQDDVTSFMHNVEVAARKMQPYTYGFNINSASVTVNSEDSDISSNDEYCKCETNDEYICG